MTNSGDAAEQIVRFSLEGTEVALKLTGSAAKNVAAAIYAVLKNRDKNKIKGRQRLTAMLKSGRELKVFTVSEEHLKQFATEAKRYGVVYCALRGKEPAADGMVDVMVRAEDASKINRIVERFNLATVDAASIKSEIEQSREGRGEGGDSKAAPDVMEKQQPQKSEEDRLLDEMMGAPAQKEECSARNPLAAGTEKSPPSAPTSARQRKTAEGIKKQDRPSVRKELREIQAARKQEEQQPHQIQTKEDGRPKQGPQVTRHRQPIRKKKKTKER